MKANDIWEKMVISGLKRNPNNFSDPKECRNNLIILLVYEKKKKELWKVLVDFPWKYSLTQKLKSNLAKPERFYFEIQRERETVNSAWPGFSPGRKMQGLCWPQHLLPSMPYFPDSHKLACPSCRKQLQRGGFSEEA